MWLCYFLSGTIWARGDIYNLEMQFVFFYFPFSFYCSSVTAII